MVNGTFLLKLSKGHILAIFVYFNLKICSKAPKNVFCNWVKQFFSYICSFLKKVKFSPFLGAISDFDISSNVNCKTMKKVLGMKILVVIYLVFIFENIYEQKTQFLAGDLFL